MAPRNRASSKTPETDLYLSFGRALRTTRMRQNCTQEELAARCDMSRSYLSSLERGMKEPCLSTIVRLANSLGVKAIDLIGAFEADLAQAAGVK